MLNSDSSISIISFTENQIIRDINLSNKKFGSIASLIINEDFISV